MHKASLLLICFFTSLNIFAQSGNLAGTVSFTNEDPVVNAHLHLKEINVYAITNLDGQYSFRNIPFGNYTLVISTVEAGTTTVSITIDSSSANEDLILKHSENNLEEILLKGNSKVEQLKTQGFAVNVIETEEASRRNIQTNELLNRSVGIKVRQNGGLGSEVDYNLNGMSGNSVKIFIDGIPSSTYGSSFDLNSLSPAMIERIEVYKGVIPAELSDDALGGAINVVLKREANNHLNASLSYGSFNTTQANFNGMYSAENSGFYVRASGFYNYSDNDYEIWGDLVYNILPNGRLDYIRTKRNNDAYRSVGAVTEVGYKDVAWADNFSIGYNYSDSYNEIQHGLFMTTPYKGRFMEANANILTLNYTKSNIIEGLDVNFRALYSNRDRVLNDTIKYISNWDGSFSRNLRGERILRQDSRLRLETVDREIFSMRGGLSYSLNNNHRIIFNHLFQDIYREDIDEMKTVLQKRFEGTRGLQKNISSLTYELRLFEEKLQASLFGKYYQQKINKMDPVAVTQNGESVRIEEYFEKDTDVSGYGAAASYAITPVLRILTSAEKAVRLPSERETFGDEGENIIANPLLRPEVSDNLNVGFNLGFLTYQKHKISFAANGFLRDTEDKIMRQTRTNLNDAIESAPNINLGKTKSSGFDAELNYVYNNNLNILMNFSKFDMRYNTKYDNNGNVLVHYDQQIPNQPFLTANANVQYTLKNIIQEKSLLHLFYNFSYTDSFYSIWNLRDLSGIDAFIIPQQYIQDAGLTYVFPSKDITVSFDAKNIFNRQAYDNFAVQKPGRAFYLKINYTINNF
ncbi:TonB-dependent receptor [Salegentibacter sp. F188]|uniref:TonB-dependent receptor n=1 Tax=Autumnicola patrickiae TaxID=3075591 RepID=A0ABU3E6J4_9FLAO|nr:TonB-dependent receptor plug domain-containing protein [Salegentibacter sp. F188]MDT0691528.1 TonB-dependent receptor [Salegentibacter sp. F188]